MRENQQAHAGNVTDARYLLGCSPDNRRSICPNDLIREKDTVRNTLHTLKDVFAMVIDREGATSAVILHFKSGEPASLPAEFVADIGESTALTVLHHKDRIMKIYPVESDNIYLLRIEISDLSRDFLKQLNFSFNDAKLSDIIFTTGVCLRGEKCYYECYFVPDQLVVSLDELQNSLEKIPGVSRVVLRRVESS